MAAAQVTANHADHAAATAAAPPAAAPASTPIVSPENVGYLFVKQYYTTLHSHPNNLHRFYKKQSVFTHGEERETIQQITGQQVR